MPSRTWALFVAAAAASVVAGCTCGGGNVVGDGRDGAIDGASADAAAIDGARGDAGDVERDAGPEGDGGGELPRECGLEDVCYDGLDNDCDGVVDDGCPCVPGETGACFRGDPRHRTVGACRDGTYVCTGSFEFGTWGPCEGDLGATLEVCDTAGVDDDCDGAANEECECFDGEPPVLCGTDVGECATGLQGCIGGRRTTCEGAVLPAVERCNALDDDCDGNVDEDLRRFCGPTLGTCRAGTETCTEGGWGECMGGREPSTEACDALDNDCDGSVDELVVRTCGVDLGRCVAGTEACVDGLYGACTGRVDPALETCNGVDDDCDATVDERLSRSCGTSDVGECALGVETCSDNAWSACVGAVEAVTEACDGALDDNCDGVVDDGCTCVDGATRACGTDVGACVAGAETCDGTLGWGVCEGLVGPRGESCNATDDDCDGRVDETLMRSCGVTDVGACALGSETCAGGSFGACVGAVLPAIERCDGAIDENCDGRVDEGCSCTTGATRGCGSDVGACVAGRETCSATGTWGACTGSTGAATESCNAADDDCDGRVDETLARSCGTDVGACVAGTETCSVGAWGACAGSIGASPEACDGVRDEDCDTIVDEGCACVSGSVRSCGTDAGECAAGSQTCTAGAWGSCLGTIGPAPERCDGTRDENCDGAVDEGCLCSNGQTRGCGTDVGACVAGRETCDITGTWGSCVGAVGAVSESCNGLDDDCDSRTDETLTRACGTDVGECARGTETCSAGGWGVCAGSTGATTERCDGSRDEDCDGAVDEGCLCTNGQTRGCGTDVGACVAGTETCNLSGAWGACTGARGPMTESCNALDDDCDARTDETLTRGCGTDVGECSRGTETCSAGGWSACAGSVGPSPDTCDGALDQDCDAAVDEGCLCTSGQTRSCGTDVGRCVAGSETCSLSGAWGACAGSVGPSSEACDGVDDDCDARIDEGACVPPIVGCPGDQSTMVGATTMLVGSGSDPDGGAVTFAWSVVTRPAGSTANPSPAGAASTSFQPDVAGSYTLRVCVTDDELESSCCTAMVTAISSCTPPARPILTSCGASWDRRPLVEFAALPAGVTLSLLRSGDATPYATITMDGQNYHRPTTALGAGAPPPGAPVSVYGRACLDSDATCCATGDPIAINLIESCTTPIAPSSANLVFSEYVTDGDGMCTGPACEAGEAIEITNLSHCPVALDGHHFSYCNGTCGAASVRYMNFGAAEIIPPRGVYVAIRQRSDSICMYPFLRPDDPGLFGLRVSTLAMQGTGLSSGWFANGAPGGRLRIATGSFVDMTTGSTIELVNPYITTAGMCESIGFGAYDACGDVSGISSPTSELAPNQLGRLWQPCDAVVSPVPATCM